MIKITDQVQEATCITHSGTIHADEVFASAFLGLCLEDIIIYRTNQIEPTMEEKIIYDIGYGRFDHHQKDALIRANGIKYASFGLLYKAYGKKLLERLALEHVDEIYEQFENDFVMQIDAIDNGLFPTIEASYKVSTISDIISFFNPSFGSREKENDCFLKAVLIAQEIIQAAITKTSGKIKARHNLLPFIQTQTGPILRLPYYLPYEQVLLEHSKNQEFLFVLYPSNRGGYAAKTLPLSVSDKTSRHPFPLKWAGLEKEALEKESGVKGALFCHVNRFLISAETKEALEKLLEITLSTPKD